ncbi:hypothetical protein [Nonomuraea helvata]|uniref:Reverse transcriptase domain-containing protein n=1 Tax=Nonomuraea helvata TaxID=37484 RepID=A0ABV5S1N5_9ACTN
MDVNLAAAFDRIGGSQLFDAIEIILRQGMIAAWLKTGVVRGRHEVRADQGGHSQGGVSSPCLLNIALRGLEEAAGVRYHAGRQAGELPAGSPTAIAMRGLRGENAEAVLFVIPQIVRVGWPIDMGCVLPGVRRPEPLHVAAHLQMGVSQPPNKPKFWIIDRYFGPLHASRTDRWVFGHRDSDVYLPESPGRRSSGINPFRTGHVPMASDSTSWISSIAIHERPLNAHVRKPGKPGGPSAGRPEAGGIERAA